MISKRYFVVRFLVPALAALLPMLMLGGSMGDGQALARPAALVSAQSEGTSTSDLLVLKVYFRDAAERDRLATELGAEEMPTTSGFLTVVGDPQMQRDLQARGLRVEVDGPLTKDVRSVNITWGSDPTTFYGGYNTVEEMQAFMDQMVANYPTLAEKVDIGDSWCKANPGQCTVPNAWNGFDLWVLHITNRNIAGPKPVFWYESGIHSREIATPEMAMNFIRLLLDGYNSNADSHWLVDYHDIWVMPMFNPDGHHMVEAGGNNPYMQRKNANRTNCSNWPPPGIGIDNNRNFPFKWACCGGSSGSACSDTYRGPSAGSEIETQAVINKIRSLIPDQRGPNDPDPAPLTTTGIYQSMHSNAELNLYPWGWTSSPSPNNAEMGNIGRHMQAANADPPGNGYPAGQPPVLLYAVDGDTMDWGYGELGIPSFTTEVGGSGFFPTYSYTQNTMWPENRGALVYTAKIASTPYLLSRGPDTKLVATNPMTVTQGSPSQLTATINYVWTGNSFSQNVGAAEYYIDTPPWAGGTAIPMNGTFNSPTVNVDATINTTSIPVGRHIIFVRGRGAADYQGHQTWGPVTATWLEVTDPNITPTLPVPTITATPTATSTSTIAPTGTASTTPIPCCGNLTVGLLPSCTVNQGTGNPSIDAFVEIYNMCANPVAVTSGTRLLVSIDGTNWVQFASIPERTVVVPPAPPPYGIHDYYPDQNIPAEYNYYQIYSVVREVSGCREYFNFSQAYPICRQGGGTVTSTPTSTATSTVTACAITFTDVPTTDPFYASIRCLACRGIVSGYADGTFKPNNPVTRGQLAKIVSGAAGFSEPVSGQTFQDVPPTHTFYEWIERLASRGYMTGYVCGGAGEPCVNNRPYFRPQANATRGQTSKIVANAAMFNEPVSGQTFQDVSTNHTFYEFIQRLANRNVMSGYQCGGPGEPCVGDRPYFRPGNDVTRGQSAKIVANTFFPTCDPTSQP